MYIKFNILDKVVQGLMLEKRKSFSFSFVFCTRFAGEGTAELNPVVKCVLLDYNHDVKNHLKNNL